MTLTELQEMGPSLFCLFAGIFIGATVSHRRGYSRGWRAGFERHKELLAEVWDRGRGDYFEARRKHDLVVSAVKALRSNGEEER